MTNNSWLSLNFLNLNEDKTEVIGFGLSEILDMGSLGPLAPHIHSFDSVFDDEKQISCIVRSNFFQLRLDPWVIHVFITSQLDYRNSLYMVLDQSSIRHLQLVHNAAARLLTGKKKRDHITTVLLPLHWLPVHYRIDSKIELLAFKSLNGLAPPYLAELIHVHTPVRELRSAPQILLDLPETRLIIRGDRVYAVAPINLWNSLPLHIGFSPYLAHFKTHLFSVAFFSSLERFYQSRFNIILLSLVV